jgi:3-phenylpropionate/trans-cinnamate dioxygenase ferredoxin reductase subunit
MTDRILIIGAGQAAAQAAATLRSKGFSGTLTLVGEEPYAPYQRPPLSKAYLAGTLEVERLALKPPAFYEGEHITLKRRTRATSLDPKARTVALSDGTKETYDKLLLSTGARVRRVSLPGSTLANIFYLRGIDDADAIRGVLKPDARLVTVGGGYIGLEVTASAIKRGTKATVVEMAPRLMMRVVSEPVSNFYLEEHRQHGAEIRLNAMVQAFEGEDGKLARVRLADGNTIEADCAVVGVGIEPNVELAAEAGLACDDGIVTDEFGQTSEPDIFAAGDCANHPNPFVGGRIRLESVQNAIDQAKHAALAILGEKTPYAEVPWFWSDQYDLKLQIAGISAGHDEMITRGDPATRSFAVFYLREGRIIAVDAVNAAHEYMFGRKLIAARARILPARLADKRIAMKELAKL